MPNWCENDLSIIGSKEELDRLVEYVTGERDIFSFNAILPMPEELQGTRSPATIVTQEEYDNYGPPSNGYDVGKPITKEMSDRLIEQYGVDNWYDWANNVWGTKWDTTGGTSVRHNETELTYCFETAWCPPEGIYEELTMQFPTLEFSLHWSEEGGASGIINTTDDIVSRETSRELNAKLKTLIENMAKKNIEWSR